MNEASGGRVHVRVTRILLEGVAITASILAAFAIQAWWDGRQDADLERAALRTLLAEVELLEIVMDSATAEHAAVVSAGTYLLSAIHAPDGRDADSVAMAAHRIESMFLWGTDVRTYDLLVGSGRLNILADPSIAESLVYLRNLFDIVNQFQAREEAFLEGQLGPFYDAGLDRSRYPWWTPGTFDDVKLRTFPTNYLALLNDRTFNNLVQRRLSLLVVVDGFYPRIRRELAEIRAAAAASPHG